MQKNHFFSRHTLRILLFLYLVALIPAQALGQDIRTYRMKMNALQEVVFDFPLLRATGDFRRFPAQLQNGETRLMGHRVVLKLREDTDFSQIKPLLSGIEVQVHPLKIRDYTLLETRSVLQAAELAAELSTLDSVLYAAPEYEIEIASSASFAHQPNDKYWSWCWHLDRRDENGIQTGWDMGARSAWAVTQ